jgi:hypothetical protein
MSGPKARMSGEASFSAGRATSTSFKKCSGLRAEAKHELEGF